MKIKSLNVYLESLLDDDDVYLSKTDDEIIKKYINNNYTITGRITIPDDFVVNCKGSVLVKNLSITSLTNGLFRWGKVGGNFICALCDNLTSLEGAPEKVDGDFDCHDCKNLISLGGAPKEIYGNFKCNNCTNLTSLKGASKKVGGNFDCSDCVKLESLKDTPKKVGRDVICHNCPNLKIADSDRKNYTIGD